MEPSSTWPSYELHRHCEHRYMPIVPSNVTGSRYRRHTAPHVPAWSPDGHRGPGRAAGLPGRAAMPLGGRGDHPSREVSSPPATLFCAVRAWGAICQRFVRRENMLHARARVRACVRRSYTSPDAAAGRAGCPCGRAAARTEHTCQRKRRYYQATAVAGGQGATGRPASRHMRGQQPSQPAQHERSLRGVNPTDRAECAQTVLWTVLSNWDKGRP